jgi:hypothetical protein
VAIVPARAASGRPTQRPSPTLYSNAHSYSLGSSVDKTGDSEAEPLFRQALALQIQALGPEHLQVALTLDDLATTSVHLAKCLEAETLFRRAVAIHEKLTPRETLTFAETLEHYADMMRRTNRNADAQRIERRIMAIRKAEAT